MPRFSEVLGNSQKLDGGSMFGNAPRAVWERWAPADEQGRIDLACRALLIEFDDCKVLCEAGIGAFFEPKMADRFGVQTPEIHQLLESLKKLEVSPDEINWVILSHLHFDHAGGLLPIYSSLSNGTEELVFPKAQYVVGHEAFSRAEEPHFRDKASFIPGLTDKLKATDRLHLLKEGDASPVHPEAISFVFSHGHTPGQMHTKIKGEQETLFFAGDLIPGTPWVHLPITMGYDRFAEKVIDEKQEVYQTAVAEGWEVFYTHDPQVACSQIEKNEKGRFQPKNRLAQPKRLRF